MDIKKKITETAKLLENNYKSQSIFELGIGEKMPKRPEIIDIINEIRRIIFPGYFGDENTVYVTLSDFAGNTLAIIYEKLFKQIRTAFMYQRKIKLSYADNKDIESETEKITLEFIDKLPDVQKMLFKDIEAQLQGDPAAESLEDIIFSYPGIYAIFVYRTAHILYEKNVPFIPRIMAEHAHGKTGIDINPGAEIGEYFFIDHGTGIVIGETTKIGDHVKIYQGVTLGALSTMKGQALSGIKRHPTIKDHAVIYANATVLGGDTVIGKNSVIAGNTFITHSVPDNTTVSALMPELDIKKH